MTSSFLSSSCVASLLNKSDNNTINAKAVAIKAFGEDTEMRILATEEVEGHTFNKIMQFTFKDNSVLRVYQPTKEEQITFDLPESWVKWARSESNFTTGRGIRSAVSGMPLFGVSLAGLAGLAEMEEVA